MSVTQSSQFRYSLAMLLALTALVSVLLAVAMMHGDETVLLQTGRELDMAIVGDGYFQVEGDGPDTLYTRTGRFVVDENDELALESTGGRLEPVISIPPGTQRVVVRHDGLVQCVVESELASVGFLQLSRFGRGGAELRSVGDDLLTTEGTSARPMATTFGDYGTGLIQQGWLEETRRESTVMLLAIPAAIACGWLAGTVCRRAA